MISFLWPNTLFFESQKLRFLPTLIGGFPQAGKSSDTSSSIVLLNWLESRNFRLRALSLLIPYRGQYKASKSAQNEVSKNFYRDLVRCLSFRCTIVSLKFERPQKLMCLKDESLNPTLEGTKFTGHTFSGAFKGSRLIPTNFTSQNDSIQLMAIFFGRAHGSFH